MDKKNVLIEVKDLSKHFNVGRNLVLKAVDDVTFNIYKGETFGVVGESGCGKTTCGRTVLGMYDATKGQVLYEGKDIHSMDKKERFDFKKKAQYIFQDPYASLDPRMTIGSIIAEGMDVHFKMTDEQRQRVGIARCLAVEPEFIVCDEPISALDVSIQAQIVNLLNKLQNEMGLTYMFISHDLSMVKHISDRIAVMYLGSVAELAQADMIYEDSLHPYTQALISAIPVPDPHVGKKNVRIKIEGEVPSPINVPPGCKFAGRCPKCMDICRKENPRLREVKPEHFVACHLYDGKEL